MTYSWQGLRSWVILLVLKNTGKLEQEKDLVLHLSLSSFTLFLCLHGEEVRIASREKIGVLMTVFATRETAVGWEGNSVVRAVRSGIVIRTLASLPKNLAKKP